MWIYVDLRGYMWVYVGICGYLPPRGRALPPHAPTAPPSRWGARSLSPAAAAAPRARTTRMRTPLLLPPLRLSVGVAAAGTASARAEAPK